MFFPVSKVFWALAEPFGFLVTLGLIGVFLGFTRWARAGRVIAAISILGLALGLLAPLGPALLRPLEDRFPQPAADMPAPAGIIVLGGAIASTKSAARGQAILTHDGSRVTLAVDLARRFPNARLVFSGGAGALWGEEPPEAIAARELWLSLGVPVERMSFEGKSRNTWENALYTKELLDPQPGQTWLLVTSAWHMPRSVGIFRRLGFNVVAYPVAYNTFGDSRDWGSHLTVLDHAIMLDFSVKEWIGLLAYWLTGKTNALFPAP